mmetsp:Transcript_43837/g.124102  ORF Transcript_43837/g.124102 Transcript_43837/m.124102 type:complete len:245 (-) Transcript_43837:146-880(-)|eukprot:CAMPEP_0179286338 /NCGR_PEP_ID=MMETSP0797-20121207/39690_1 /TAXON_ID=47934 /ORGANISM="Dinophysis acuminata, Strain DAEP01" /LENGTH=244 /DNA_ID=CAMNT_0020995219 /DNA_START=51 /DNA_END=785 /DNA_ORIENTATION=+
MATWGALGSSWQNAAGAPERASLHPTLFEAFGRDVRVADDPNNYARGSCSHVFADSSSMIVEEVPRVFSMESHRNFGGDATFQSADFGSGMGARTSPSIVTGTLPAGDPCWVTVFGFPGRTATLVRQQLETLCGPIAEVYHGDGNFMHVRFQSPSAANTCLAHNGHAILGKLLIGCVPCASGLRAMGEANDGESMFKFDGPPSAGVLPGSGRFTSPLAHVVSRPGPEVKTNGFIWRLLDLIFDL